MIFELFDANLRCAWLHMFCSWSFHSFFLFFHPFHLQSNGNKLETQRASEQPLEYVCKRADTYWWAKKVQRKRNKNQCFEHCHHITWPYPEVSSASVWGYPHILNFHSWSMGLITYIWHANQHWGNCKHPFCWSARRSSLPNRLNLGPDGQIGLMKPANERYSSAIHTSLIAWRHIWRLQYEIDNSQQTSTIFQICIYKYLKYDSISFENFIIYSI